MKKFFRLLTFLAFVFIMFSTAACSNGNDENSNSGNNSSNTSNTGSGTDTTNKEKIISTTKKLNLNLTDATNLYIGKTTSNITRAARAVDNSTENKLFKITEDGYVQEISYTYEVTSVIEYEENVYDENGVITGTETKTKTEVKTETATENFTPTKIIKLNKKYLIVCFSSDNYLVNSETGAAYKYANEVPYISNSLSYYYGDSVSTDSADNIYYVSSSNIVKLDVSNPNSVTLKKISATTENVKPTVWGVDANGNIAYEGTDASGNGVLRFKSTNGGYSNLPGNTNHSFTMFWQGLDGLLYYFNASNENTKIKKLNASPFNVTDYSEEQNATGNMGACGFKALLKAKNKNRIILLADGSAYPEFYEVYNPDTNTLKKIEASVVGLNKIKFGISSDDYYFLVGTDSANNSTLVKIEPTDYTYETLLSDGAYDIYNLSISNEAIIFNALRMNDGAIVLGKIASDKSISILDENLEEQITVLERIK